MKKFKNLKDYINTVYHEVYEVRKANFLLFHTDAILSEYDFTWTYDTCSENYLIALSEKWSSVPYVAFWNGEILRHNKLEDFLSKEGIYAYRYFGIIE